MKVLGDLPDATVQLLHDFESAAANHPWGGAIDGRLVIARPHPAGFAATLRRGLEEWMPSQDFAAWEQQQIDPPVVTAAKTFVGTDGIVTAVICPLGDLGTLLGIAAHEMLEIASEHRFSAGPRPESADELNGFTLLNEYVLDRARLELTISLGWAPSWLDVEPNLVQQLDDLVSVLARLPQHGTPPREFWLHWVNIARVWAMAAGRADAGSRPEQEVLAAFGDHKLISESGWTAVQAGYRQDFGAGPRSQTLRLSDAVVTFKRVEMLGRNVWATS